MANTVPVLSYNVNPDNIFDRYKIGYHAAGNKDEFFKQFENLLNNHWLSEKLGNNGRIYLEKYHNKALIIKKMINILTND
jgi:glycosyltransferase involved in cell wall biosynthesis